MRLRGDLIVLGYADHPALEGSNIDPKYLPGLTLVDPNASTCMGNGEWEPDLREVECHGKNNLNMNSPLILNKHNFLGNHPCSPS